MQYKLLEVTKLNINYKIGFVGPYSTANFGDWAMLVNNIYDLNYKNIVVFTYNPMFPKRSLEEYCQDFNVKYVEVKLKNEIETMKNCEMKDKQFITPLEVLMKLNNTNEVYDAIEDIDILVISGGGWLNHFWTERIEKVYKMMIPIYVARQKQKKIVFTANGIGPFDETREFYRYFFGYIKNANIAIRDNLYSMSHLLEVGIEKENVCCIPDDLYLINSRLLSKEPHKHIQQKDYIVMETFYPLEKLKQYKERLINFSKIMYKKYGLSIVLLPYDLVQYGADQAKYLHSILDKSELFNIDDIGYLPIQDAYRIIKNAKMMITSRYHGLVLSLNAETPVIFRLYKRKNDIRYSYNKGLGMLRMAFDGIKFCETDYLQYDFLEILDNVENNLQQIISNQRNIYSNPIYRKNKVKLKEFRHKYLRNLLC